MTRTATFDELQMAKDSFYVNKEFASQIEDELNGYFNATLSVYEMYVYKTQNSIPLSEIEQNQVLNMIALPLSL